MEDEAMKLFLIDCNRSSYLDYAMQVIVGTVRDRRRGECSNVLRQASPSIINECTIACGENVGASSITSAAPEVAASDEDGDGDGDSDGDPDPNGTTLTQTLFQSMR